MKLNKPLKKMINDYETEARQHLDIIKDSLVQLKKKPGNKEHLKILSNRAHTIKGMSVLAAIQISDDLSNKSVRVKNKHQNGSETILINHEKLYSTQNMFLLSSLNKIAKLAHLKEDIAERMAEGKIKPKKELVASLEKSHKVLEKKIANIIERDKPIYTLNIINELKKYG